MTVLDLNEDNIDDFMDVIDENAADCIGRKFFRGKVLLDAREGILGSLIWEYKNQDEDRDNEAEIVWMQFPDRNAGQMLLDAYKSDIDEEGVIRTTFEIPRMPEYLSDVLKEQGFIVKEKESRDVYVTLESLASQKFAAKKAPSYILGLEDISDREYRQGIIGCLYRGRKGILEDLAVLPREWYETELSCAVKTDNELTGFLLIRQLPTGVLMPVLFNAMGPNYQVDLVNMIRFAVQKGKAAYGPDTKILIRRHTPAVKALADKLFPGVGKERALAGIRQEATRLMDL